MTATPIQPFKAEIPVTGENGKKSWHRCEVVAVSNEFTGYGQFTVLVEDEDGLLWTHTVDCVRRIVAIDDHPWRLAA